MAGMKELGNPLRSWAEGFENDSNLDGPARRLQGTAAILIGSGRRLNFLRGRWLGHSFHPLLTDFPLGAWASASFLDLFGPKDTRSAAEALVAFGLVAAIPTALSGLADWSEADRESKRVGVVHAGLNSAVAGFYASSLVARRKEHHSIGVTLGVCGGLLAWASGYLGGHLSLVRDAGHDRDHGEQGDVQQGQKDELLGNPSSQSLSENEDDRVETASRDSFPASDPPAW
jgi:uncharacterized membrane protein